MSEGGRNRRRRWLFSLRRYISFFLLMAFVISCCMILFLNTVARSTGMELTQAHIETAAKLTFLNVVLLSLLCTVIDGLRRKWPVRQIIQAAEQMMKGDFSVRIPPIRSVDSASGFEVIADYFNRMAHLYGDAQEKEKWRNSRTFCISSCSRVRRWCC